MEKRTVFHRTQYFALALLLSILLPLQSVSALFGKNNETTAADDGAPIAQNMEIRVYRNVPYTGTFCAIDNEGESISFAVVMQPQKGNVEITEDGTGFVYIPAKNKLGSDSFTYCAADESGNTSLPATVKVTIVRTKSGVSYADTEHCSCATAAMDLAERGIFTGAHIGGSWFFEPEQPVTRGEFIAMTMAASGEVIEGVTMTGFCDDESIPTWCKSYASSALRSGILYGIETENGIAFDADAVVTLNEAAAVMDRFLNVTDVNLADYEAVDSWSAQAVANLMSVNVLPSGAFTAEGNGRLLTRGEAAELLSSAMTLQEQKAGNRGLLGELLGE